VDWLVLAVYGAVLTPAAMLVWRRPVLALYAFVVGLVLHNTVSLLLFAAGVEGWQLTFVQSWKETLLAVALTRGGWDLARGRRAFRVTAVDVVAVVFAAAVVLYALIPQSALGGEASPKAELYGLRHYLLPVAAFFAGRLVPLRPFELRVAAVLCLGAAAAASVVGIAEEYLVSVETWRSLGADQYFSDQLGFPELHGPGGLPENFVLNTSDGVFRRLVSLFLSPLGSAYFFVAVLGLAAARLTQLRRVGLEWAAVALVFAGLLFSFTRSAIAALAGGLAVLALALRRAAVVGFAGAVVAVSIGFAALFPHIAPETHFLAADLAYQEQRAREEGALPAEGPLGSSVRLADPSARSHLDALAEGGRALASQPQGYGVGNAGQVAQRFGVPARAGESFYLELGVDTGVVGLALWLSFLGLVLAALVMRVRPREDRLERRFAAGLLVTLLALSAVAVVSDVWNVPWVVYVVWWFVGSVLSDHG
jgi:hypothetical protein